MRLPFLSLLLLPAVSALAFTGCVVHEHDYHREGYYREDVHRAPPPPPPIEHRDDVRIDVHP